MKQLETTSIDVPLAKIKTGQYQQRVVFDVTELRGLAQTIKADGLITPPTVMAVNGHYELIMGDRRRRALWALALESDGLSLDEALVAVCGPTVDDLPERFGVLHQVTARVNLSQESDPISLRMMATIENLQRVDLSPLEKAQGFQSLLDAGLQPAEVVEKTGESWSQIGRYLKLLTLPESVRVLFDNKALPMGVLKELSELPAEVIVEVAEKMVGRKSREIKAVVKRVKGRLPPRPSPQPWPPPAEREGESFSGEEPQQKPKRVREQLAEAKDLISKLTMQIHLDGRLLARCAEVMQECAPDSRVTLMAWARAQQIEKSIKGRQHPPTVSQQQRHFKVELFIEKRQRAAALGTQETRK